LKAVLGLPLLISKGPVDLIDRIQYIVWSLKLLQNDRSPALNLNTHQ
jgi:hypothetical protein